MFVDHRNDLYQEGTCKVFTTAQGKSQGKAHQWR